MNLLPLLVPIILLFLPTLACGWLEADLVVKRWKLLSWRNVSVVLGDASWSSLGTVARLVKEASAASVLTAVQDLLDNLGGDKFEEAGVRPCQNRMVLVASPRQDQVPKLEEMLRTSMSDTVMVATKYKSSSYYWNWLNHTLSFYWLAGRDHSLSRIVTTRREGEVLAKDIVSQNEREQMDAMGMEMLVASKPYHPYLVMQCQPWTSLSLSPS